MDFVKLNYLYVLIVMVANKLTRTAGDCKVGSKVTHRPYSETMVNHTIVGPIMSSIHAKNERECEMECHLAVPDLCHMFNYHPSSKVCELLYKDRAAEYKVEKKQGSTFKTRKCDSSPCKVTQKCVSLGDQNNNLCLNYSGLVIKSNTAPVCIGARNVSYGTFFAPADGKIKFIKLVLLHPYFLSTNDSNPHIELHITDTQNSRITPPPGYPLNLPLQGGMRNGGIIVIMSLELVFPEISPPLAVTKGKEFRIWVGQDLNNGGKDREIGETCADVHVFFSN